MTDMLGAIPDIMRTVYYFVALGGILAAGWWAWKKARAFRNFKPSLDLSLEIQAQRVSNDRVYFLVSLTMKNTSKVLVDYGHTVSDLHRLSGVSDHCLERLRDDATQDTWGNPIAWPPVDACHSRRIKKMECGEATIEPGATETQYYEFIVNISDDEHVLVKCAVYDRESQSDSAWLTQTIYKVGGKSNG